jgi:hypothetical protein
MSTHPKPGTKQWRSLTPAQRSAIRAALDARIEEEMLAEERAEAAQPLVRLACWLSTHRIKVGVRVKEVNHEKDLD